MSTRKESHSPSNSISRQRSGNFAIVYAFDYKVKRRATFSLHIAITENDYDNNIAYDFVPYTRIRSWFLFSLLRNNE